MKRFFTLAIAAIAAFTIGATTVTPSAEAGKRERRIAAGIFLGAVAGAVIADRSYRRHHKRYRHGRYYRHGHYYGHRRYYKPRRYYRSSHRHYRAPRYYAPRRYRRVYYERPRYVAPRRHYGGRHARCAAKYRSYNPRTGMYLAHSGRYRRCRL